MKELIALRSENSKTYDLGDGKRRLVTGGAVHYKDNYDNPSEQWKDIDFTFVNGKVTKAPYLLEVDGLSITVTSKKTGTVQTLTLDKVGSENSIASTGWSFVGNQAIWENAVLDTDIVIEAGASLVRFKRILHSANAPLEAEFTHSKIIGKADDIRLSSSARDADGESLELVKSDVAGKLAEALDISNLVSKEGKLYYKRQYLDDKEELIEELIEVKYPIEIDPTLTVQPAAKDTHLVENSPDVASGSDTHLTIRDYTGSIRRGLLEFDISELPSGATINSANLQLYYWAWEWLGDPVGKTAWAYKQTHLDWVEAQATWNIYKTGSSWTSVGGDYVTSAPSGGSTTFPGSYGWMTWNVLAIVQDAYTGETAVELLLRFATEPNSSHSLVHFHSSDYTDDTDLCPKLVIDYTLAPTVTTQDATGIGFD